MLFGIKSSIVWISNWIVNLFTRKRFKETKIKSYSNEAKHLHDEEIPKVGCNYTCLVVILINFVLQKDENYCLPKFLQECKYTKKEKKNWDFRYITNENEVSSDDSDGMLAAK